MAYNRYIKNRSLDPEKPTRRPRKIIERREKFFVRWLEKDTFVGPERRRVLFTSFSADKTVCVKTIHKMLRRRGYSGRAAAKKVTHEIQYSPKEIGVLSASQEVRVRPRSHGRDHVWRRPGKRYDPKYTKYLSTDQLSLMFWGVISSTGQKILIKRPP